MAPAISGLAMVSVLLLLCTLSVVSVNGRAVPRSVVSVPPARQQPQRSIQSTVAFLPRGGATLAADDEYDSEEYDEYDEESEDEEEAAAALAAAAKAKAVKKAAKKAALSASTVKAAAKAKSKKSKDAVNVKLAATSARSSSSRSPLLKIPYIFRAFLNPFTVIAMTKAYWQSLFNIKFMEEEAAQPLRSALEEKAKRAGGSTGLGGRGGKRRYKPGQAKTLADLPQLSA
jgi:hypothetical protein